MGNRVNSSAAGSIHFSDPQLTSFVIEEIGHEPPFTPEEIASLESVDVFDMDQLRDLIHFKYTDNINIVGARDGDLGFLSEHHFENLLQLGVEHAPVSDLRPVLHPPQLGSLHLRYTKVEDLTPLLAMKHLNEISLEGCPLSEESYFEVLPRLAREDKDTIFGRRPPTIRSLSQEPEWRITRRLHERGLDLCYVRNGPADGRGYVCVTRSGLVQHSLTQGTQLISSDLLLELLADTTIDEATIIEAARQYRRDLISAG